MSYNTQNIFSKISKEDFRELLDVAGKFKQIDKDALYTDYCTGNTKLDDLKKLWVKSINAGAPDFSLYNDDLYINESFVCWKIYSRRYLQLLNKYLNGDTCEIDKGAVKNILDVGCGCGFTTVGLKSLFPGATVKATNLKGTLQYNIDIEVTKDTAGIEIHDDSEIFNLGKIDMIFASEFFEHLEEPFKYLQKLIDAYRPKYIVYANTFTNMAIGHFNSYEGFVGGKASLNFTKTLKQNGYTRVKSAKFFNNRPYIYQLTEN